MNRRKLLSLLGMSPVVMAAESALGAQSEKKPAAPVTTHPAFAKLATGACENHHGQSKRNAAGDSADSHGAAPRFA